MSSVLSKKQKQKQKQKKMKREKTYSLAELKTLGHHLLSSRSHINNLPILLNFISPSSPPQHALESLLSLQSFFTTVLPQLPPSSSSSNHPSIINSSQNDPEFIYRTWLRSKFDDFLKSLIVVSISPDTEDPLREVILDTLMDFVKVGNSGKFHSSTYHRLIQTIVHSSLGVDVLLDLLVSKYFNYIDIRYFTYITLEKLARTLEARDASDNRSANVDGNNESESRVSIELSIHKIYHILSHIPPPEGLDDKADYEMWNGLGIFVKEDDCREHSELLNKKRKKEKSSNTVLSVVNVAKKVKLKFTKAWISFLRLPLPLDVYKEVLVTLHQAVIPYLSNPIMLCDFLTRSYDIGGVISVMALSSLYVLMTQHGLEYPNFYEKLYALLVPSIFLAKHRARFFELLDSCLKSPLLPAYLAAAFAKKLSRLALSVPSSGELVVIALIHNLLRRHPSINCLVHQEYVDGAAGDDSGAGQENGDGTYDFDNSAEMSGGKKPGIDHFNNEETDPLKTNAMRSSLWEIDTLRHHYCPPISRFVLSLENDLTIRSKTTEIAVKDFSSGSYATIFGEEIRRRVKQVPLAFYKATPTSLFSESDFTGWTFKCQDEEELASDDKGTTNLLEEHGHNSVKRQQIECS